MMTLILGGLIIMGAERGHKFLENSQNFINFNPKFMS